MECDPTRVCELLAGLGDVEIVGVDDGAEGPLRVHIRGRAPRPPCGGCGGLVWSKGERSVELVDLPPHSQTRMAQAPPAMPPLGVCGGLVQRAGPCHRGRSGRC